MKYLRYDLLERFKRVKLERLINIEFIKSLRTHT